MTKPHEAPEAQTDFVKGILPTYISETAIDDLTYVIHEQIHDSPVIQDALEACNLDPTSSAAWLAAACAVTVLLAHEIGQGRDRGRGRAAEEEEIKA